MQQSDSDPRYWRAIRERDSSFDGKFYYSVATTGVYCRPSCASRQPRRENVAFHTSPEQAAAAGFRPCKRCRPGQESLGSRRLAQVEKLCRLIELSEKPLSTEALASSIGASASHAHRMFKQVTGVTPKQYAAECRRKRLHRHLQSSSTITDAIYASGYGSSSRFYGSAALELGMSPEAYRSGGTSEVIQFARAECSLGSLLIAATRRGLCSIALGDDHQALLAALVLRFPGAELRAAQRDFDRAVARVVELMDCPANGATLPLDLRGTSFQARVWAALMQIPPGETASYAEIAARIGAPRAARAVAGACAANELAVAVPCHRVVRQDGSLSGYRWGTHRKRLLLDRERGP